MSIPTEGSVTSREICIQWGESLPTRSRSDTALTIREIGVAYATFAIVCPDQAHLIPN